MSLVNTRSVCSTAHSARSVKQAAFVPASPVSAVQQAGRVSVFANKPFQCDGVNCRCKRPCHRSSVVTAAGGNGASAPAATEVRSLRERHIDILRYYPNAMGVDDLMGRIEVALAGFGFTGDNSIAMTALCRDEVTQVLKDKIEAIFGSSFNTNGLGGVLTCGVTGMGAGLSHSPVCDGGRERYVFFAFPHIAISASGEMGAITRPGRPKKSSACGALLKALGEFKSEGVACNCRLPGVHDALDPEYTILKQRLARRIRYEKLDVDLMDLPSLTSVAERTITDDLEYLIEKAVDTDKADYAVITGIQIHNWADELVEGGDTSLEFVSPAKCYTVVNGLKTYIDLPQVPSLSPRQLQSMAAQSLGSVPRRIELGARGGVMSEVPLDYLVKKLGGAVVKPGSVNAPAQIDSKASSLEVANGWPTWQSRIKMDSTLSGSRIMLLERDVNAPNMESPEPLAHPSFEPVAESK